MGRTIVLCAGSMEKSPLFRRGGNGLHGKGLALRRVKSCQAVLRKAFSRITGMVLSMSECASHCWTVHKSTPAHCDHIAKAVRNDRESCGGSSPSRALLHRGSSTPGGS